MNTAKVYQDIDGNDCSIHQMVRREPQWAARRIQEGEKAIAKLEELESSLASACHVAMPKELTAENGAKALMTGEFYETIEVGNDAFCGCGTCDFCIECPNEPESTLQKIPISWTNIKEIYAMAVKHFGAVHTPTEETN